MSEPTDPPGPTLPPADPDPGPPDDAAGAGTGLRPQLTAPTQAELNALPPDRRLELLELQHQRSDAAQDRQRQSAHQWINSAVLLVGIILATITWQTGQEELRTTRDSLATAQQSQVTDRYTKAVEQLGSAKRDVRTAATYALERIAKDSPRDATTIRDVLAAFIREHDPDTDIKNGKLPYEPDTDVQAALSVLIRRPTDPTGAPALDLHGIRVKGASLTIPFVNGPVLVGNGTANLSSTNLRGADLRSTNLGGADLSFTDLGGADLRGANLGGADLRGANLGGTDLRGANLRGANLGGTDLRGANLLGANLGGTDLRGANLLGANLAGTDLTSEDLRDTKLAGANLAGANLAGANLADVNLADVNLAGANLDDANLRGANLRGIDKLTEARIRATAKVYTNTKFGPLPKP